MEGELNPAIAAARAARQATAIDRSRISPRAGLIAAVPVTALLAIGVAVQQPVGAVTVAAGAMIVGVAWRGAGGPEAPPVGTMCGAAFALALATFAGTLSGRWPWVHLALLAVFCLHAGLASALGRRGNVIGVQAVIAFVVFGRFPESLSGAAELAGLVLLGGAVQIGVASVVARPSARRQQRAAVAGAYRALAELAATPDGSSVPAAAALDDAETRLAVPALFADPRLVNLSQLVEEGRRIRLELIALSALAGRSDAEPERVDARLAALVAQILAAARLAERARGAGGRIASGRPTRGTWRPLAAAQADLRRLRAGLSLGSAAGRHALRLAVVVPGTELLIERVALPRAYWAVIAAATVLRPEFSATFRRGAERVVGTFAGVVIATLIAVGLRPGGWAIVAIVGALAGATYTLFPASFAVGIAGMTAIVVFLLHAVAPGSVTLALDRGIDTLIGGAIGLIAYALWPTWSGRSLGRRLEAVVDAQAAYLDAVVGALVAGERLEDERLRPLARKARINYSETEAAVTVSLAEPLRGTDPHEAGATLAGLRRLVYAVHALRIDAAAMQRHEPLPQLEPLRSACQEALRRIATALGTERTGDPLPPLRRLFRAAPPPAALQESLDELIDATNTVAASLGLPVP